MNAASQSVDPGPSQILGVWASPRPPESKIMGVGLSNCVLTNLPGGSKAHFHSKTRKGTEWGLGRVPALLETFRGLSDGRAWSQLGFVIEGALPDIISPQANGICLHGYPGVGSSILSLRVGHLLEKAEQDPFLLHVLTDLWSSCLPC